MPPVKMGVKETGEQWRDAYVTPTYILDKVNALFGDGRWFDPCPTNPDFDGLDVDLDWGPRSFINPPFSRYADWANKGLSELFARLRVDKQCEQLWICHTNNSSGWFKEIIFNASAICLLAKRVHFIDPRTGEPTASSAYGKSQCILYIGPNKQRFKRQFSDLGIVAYV